MSHPNQIIIYREIHRYKVPYARPARYSSSTKLVWIDEKGEHHRYYGTQFKTYNKFIDWVKKKYGENCTYKIDTNRPTVIYQFNGNV